MTEQHELLENTASRVDEAPGTAAPADPPGFDIPPIEEDRGEPDKTVPVERSVETAPETGGRLETDATVENPTLKDVFGLVQRLSTQNAQEGKDDGARLNAGTRKLLEITRNLTSARRGDPGFEIGLEATRRQTVNELSDLAPRDRIEIQSFIWVVSDYREDREDVYP